MDGEQKALGPANHKRLLADAQRKIESENARISKLKSRRLVELARQQNALTGSGKPDWRALAMRLAEKYLTEFQVAYPPLRAGRKPQVSFELFEAVQRKLSEGKKVSEACLYLTRLPAWRGKTQKQLEAQYRRERHKRDKQHLRLRVDFSGARKKERRK